MKIAVVLAHNWANSGMYSVDLAAFRFFESLGCVVDYFVASGARPHSLFKSGQIPIYHISDAGPLTRYDRVVYWGDFTTSPYYALEDFKAQIQTYEGGVSTVEIFKRWGEIFLMRGRKIPGQRLFSFGQNFQTLSAVASRVDLKSLAPFYERFDLIMPRDTVSMGELRAHLTSIPGGALVQGCDAAFVLPDIPTAALSRDPKKIGVYFGRTKMDNPRDVLAEIEKRGYEPVMLKQWLSLPRNNFHETFLAMSATMSGCACLLTDTYHLAVNAIRMGLTPVVIGDAAGAQTSTVSDFKKRVMLRDLGAEELYMEIANSRLSGAEITRIADMVDAMANQDVPHPAHLQAKKAAEAAVAEFRQRLLN